MTNRVPLLGVCLISASCGGDGSTGPAPHNVAGTYNYSVLNLATVGLACRVRATMVVTQQSATFSGNYTGSLACTSSAGTDSTGAAGTVINGRVRGDSVYFDFDTADWHNMGVIVGSNLQGLLNVRLNVNGTPKVLAGSFTAVKQ